MSLYAQFLTTPEPGEEVVISGISGKFASSKNMYEFKQNLYNKKDMVTDITARYSLDSEEMPLRGGIINDIDKFDAGFFGIHGRQANTMDPGMRVFLETALEAIFDAGLTPVELEGTRTGVYVADSLADVEYDGLTNITEPQKMGMTGFMRNFFCHRLAYFLKLKGPCFLVNASCSSSLHALESAFADLRSGKCDRALVGGVNLTLFPAITLQFYKMGVLNLDGRCKVFDEEADGFVRSEASACVLIEKAKVSRRIYAQVMHVKASNDGFKEAGISFPSVEMQSALLKEMYDESNVNVDDISYIECHCTGTRIGDPQEVASIDNAIGKRREKPLLIGSGKSNHGHAEGASGLYAIAKVIITMETGFVPPNINLNSVKRSLNGIVEGRLKPVVDKTLIRDDPVIIGINNFGFGGNNCHSILKRLNIKRDLKNDGLPRLICASGRTEEAVLKIFEDLGQREVNPEYVRLLQEVFKFGIEGHNYRGYAIMSGKKPLKISFSRLSNKRETFHLRFGDFDKKYKVIGKSLMEIYPFKRCLTKFNHELKTRNLDIFEVILRHENDYHLNILGSVAVQIALCDTIKVLKLEPVSIDGDSWGKLALLYFQECLDVKQIVKTILENGKSPNLKMELEIFGDKINTAKQVQVLNLSNSMISLVNGTEPLQFFLEFFGSLYKSGYNPQIQNLYQDIKFPVSTGTPMISPLISWNHSKSWFTNKQSNVSEKNDSNSFQTEVFYNPFKNKQSFIQGHVVDGRNLFPAAGYLYMVWKELAKRKYLIPSDIGIGFENVKFLRAAVFPKTGYLSFVLSVQMDGTFEISQGNSVMVKGRAILGPPKTSGLPVKDFNDGNCCSVMDKEDFYKELNLRGYNYQGLFQGVIKTNLDVTSALIKWDDNWVTFLDNMSQLMIVQADTRNLHVPTEFKRCTINPSKQKSSNSEIPVTVYKELDLIKSESVEMYGFRTRSIARKKQANEPVLEKYIFVPNCADLVLEKSLRINIQVILENSFKDNIKVLELTEDSNDTVEDLSTKICKILDDVPLIKADFTISPKYKPKSYHSDLNSIKVEDVHLTIENNYLLIIGYNVLDKVSSSQKVMRCLNKDNFLITRENKNFTPEDVEGVKILTVHTTEDEKLILLRKSEECFEYLAIEVSSDNFEWLTQLQDALKIKSNIKIAIYSQNQTDSGILGLINCILNENCGDRVKCFFILGKAPRFDINHGFYKTQLEKNLSVNVYKNGKWGTYRHLLLKDAEATDNEHCLVNNTVKGDLSSLKWLHGYLKMNSKTVMIHYSSLNFKDVMIASGRISADLFVPNRMKQATIIGFEYSGLDLNGKRIMGIIEEAALATIAETDALLTWEVPKEWSLEQAATVPSVYLTVIFGLLFKAKLRRGMSILIHSGTGGIGLSAINVCAYYGCEIFVTVGTEEKRDFLKKNFPNILGDHIGNSRDTSFEQMVEKQTNGRGVDIVLNSLAEEKLLASVRCLANYGNFVEIGKFDLSQNNPLNLLILEKEATFHGVMLDTLFQEDNQIKTALAKELLTGIRLGYVQPLPRNTFSHQEVENALRFMSTGKHIGKVLVKVRESEGDTRKFVVKGLPRVICDHLKSHIIIGGLGGFGLELADWLVTRGVRKLILSSRQGVRNGYQMKRIKIWESYGVTVCISTSDVTKREGCCQLMKEAEDLGPVEGIFNLGVVLKDGAFENQSEKDFEISFGPKAFVTKFLDEISRKSCHDLRYFVVFSSISCGRGNAGQTNYGMANSVMERICENRRRDGFPGLAIEWGAIGDVGLVAQLVKSNIELEIKGTLQQKISNCLEILDRLLTQTESAVVSSMVVASKKKSYGSGTAVDVVVAVLGIKDVNTISRRSTLAQLGMDSITSTEIIRILETDFDIYLTTKDIRRMTFEEIMDAEKFGAQHKKTEFDKEIFQLETTVSDSPFLLMTPNFEDNNNNESSPVFVLPGFEGSLQSMEQITKNQTCVCLGLKYNFASTDMNIEEMSALFLPYIEEKLSSRNHFNLICHSFGGHLAMEIAHLLEKKGCIGNIIAIDTGLAYLSQSLNNQCNAEFEAIFLYNTLKHFITLDHLEPHKGKLKEFKSFEERCDYARSIAKKNIRKHDGLKDFELQVTISRKRVNAISAYNFSHQKLRSTVHLLKASNPVVTILNEDYGWSQVCEGSINIKVVDGTHSSILNSTYLHRLVNNILQN